MSAEIINLRQVRKQRERERKAAEAAENRTRFGRTKAERTLEELARTRADQALDGHLRAGPEAAETIPSDRDGDVAGPGSASTSPRPSSPKSPQ